MAGTRSPRTTSVTLARNTQSSVRSIPTGGTWFATGTDANCTTAVTAASHPSQRGSTCVRSTTVAVAPSITASTSHVHTNAMLPMSTSAAASCAFKPGERQWRANSGAAEASLRPTQRNAAPSIVVDSTPRSPSASRSVRHSADANGISATSPIPVTNASA